MPREKWRDFFQMPWIKTSYFISDQHAFSLNEIVKLFLSIKLIALSDKHLSLSQTNDYSQTQNDNSIYIPKKYESRH